jgi:hypothetical protein
VKTLRVALGWVLGFVGCFSAVYVVYAHLASIAVARRYVADGFVERFDSKAELERRFTVRRTGALAYSVEGGKLHVTGTSDAPGGAPARVELVTPARKLDESRIVMRFRVANAAAYDVMVGVESDHAGKGPASVRFGLQNDAAGAGYRWEGDPLTSLAGATATGEYPDALEQQRRAPFEAPTAWHELSLQFSMSLHQVMASVDGRPAGAVRSEWIGGTPVRVVFGVVAREPGQAIDAEIELAAVEPIPPDPRALDFDDRFDGTVIDPRRWRVELGSSAWQTTKATPSPEGLVLEGSSQTITTPHPAVVVGTEAFPLGSVHLRARVRVDALEGAGLFVGVTSTLGGALQRLFDIGIFAGATTDAGPAQRGAFVSGNWTHDGQRSFRRFGGSQARVLTFAIDYDAKTRRVKASIDGHPVCDEALDLQPRQLVRVRFGVNLDDSHGRFRVVVEDVRLSALQD